MKLYVDRIEEGYAICEDDELNQYFISIKKAHSSLKEGDVIAIDKKGKILVDEKETNSRKIKIKELQDRLFNKNKDR